MLPGGANDVARFLCGGGLSSGKENDQREGKEYGSTHAVDLDVLFSGIEETQYITRQTRHSSRRVGAASGGDGSAKLEHRRGRGVERAPDPRRQIVRLRLAQGEAPTIKELKGARLVGRSPEGAVGEPGPFPASVATLEKGEIHRLPCRAIHDLRKRSVEAGQGSPTIPEGAGSRMPRIRGRTTPPRRMGGKLGGGQP